MRLVRRGSGQSRDQWKIFIGGVALCLSSIVGCTMSTAQESTWERAQTAGEEAIEEGQYPEAERLLMVSLEEAQEFGEDDPRMARSLTGLGVLYAVQGQYVEAEPFFQLSLVIVAKTRELDDPDVAVAFSNLATLYAVTGRCRERIQSNTDWGMMHEVATRVSGQPEELDFLSVAGA